MNTIFLSSLCRLRWMNSTELVLLSYFTLKQSRCIVGKVGIRGAVLLEGWSWESGDLEEDFSQYGNTEANFKNLKYSVQHGLLALMTVSNGRYYSQPTLVKTSTGGWMWLYVTQADLGELFVTGCRILADCRVLSWSIVIGHCFVSRHGNSISGSRGYPSSWKHRCIPWNISMNCWFCESGFGLAVQMAVEAHSCWCLKILM